MAEGLMSLLALFLLNCLSQGSGQQVTQGNLDYIASNLDIRYDVMDNFQDTWRTYRVRMTFTNKGDKKIQQGDWALYLCHIRLIESKHTKHNPKGFVLPDGHGLKVFHINGCQHKFETTTEFKDLEPKQSLEVFFNSDNWAVARTDVMPNMYVAAAGLQARTVVSTAGESLSFVGAFDAPNKWKRLVGDKFDPYTPLKRFKMNDIANLQSAPKIIVPTPLQVSDVDKTKQINIGTGEWRVIAKDSFESEARFLADRVGASFDPNGESGSRTIQLTVGDVTVGGKASSSPEAYSLDVDVSREVVSIVGQSAAGLFHGVQSLLSLNDGGNLYHVSIRDAPRYEYRGMEIDVGRNFMKKEEILKLLDAMSMYKMNKLHLHLTDDEGWRLEIPGLPELTEIGSRRCFDIKEEKCVGSQLGSGAGTGNSGTGFYSVAEYKEILRYARARHIEVIPEFDMPGHGHAAIIAMKARYRKFMALGDTWRAKQYLLSDAADKSEYLSVQFFTDNAINPCIDSTYNFIEHLVSTIKRIHGNTQPLNIFHFGGDEVAHGAWTKSPKCKNLAKKLGLNFTGPSIVKDLKEHFVRRVARITNKYGLDAGAWEDGVLGLNDKPFDRSHLKNKNVYAYAWNNVWEWMQGNRAYKLANAGYKVIMTQATHLYFDHPYEPDPEERGYYWAPRYIDTRKTFGFMPDDLYANADFTRMGEPIVDLCNKMYKDKCVPLRKPQNIAGVAGALWSETVRTPKQLHSMIYPRLLALAERAWHKAPWENEKDEATRKAMKNRDWRDFANTLGHKELARLDRMNINYHVPPPGVMIYHGGLVKAKSAIPGLQIQYSKDGGKHWCDIKQGKTTVWGKVTFATRSADKRRISRSVTVQA